MKKIKLKIPFDKDCTGDTGFYIDTRSQVFALEQHLGVRSTEIRYENITNDLLENSASIFIYLNACPVMDTVYLKWFQTWITFYTDLFKTHSPDQIVLTLNRMMKSDSPLKDGILRAEKLFQRTASVMSLKYEEIQSILPRDGRDGTNEIEKNSNANDGNDTLKSGDNS